MEALKKAKKELDAILELIAAHHRKVTTRPVRFRKVYKLKMAELRSQLFGIGPHATHGAWVGGKRKNIRKLARAMARHEIKMQKS